MLNRHLRNRGSLAKAQLWPVWSVLQHEFLALKSTLLLNVLTFRHQLSNLRRDLNGLNWDARLRVIWSVVNEPQQWVERRSRDCWKLVDDMVSETRMCSNLLVATEGITSTMYANFQRLWMLLVWLMLDLWDAAHCPYIAFDLLVELGFGVRPNITVRGEIALHSRRLPCEK